MTADKKDPVEPRALTPADIMRIAETEGAQAADAALQRIVRAREAKFPEAEVPSDIESVEVLLGDLDLGADAGSAEAIEHVRELDAVAEAAVEGAIAKAEAYEGQDVLDKARKAQPKYLEQLRAARIKYNSGIEVAEDDPLALEKKMVAKKLNKVERTLADLPPDFWKLPRIRKIPGERSRQSELSRVFGEGEEEMRGVERLRELEKLGRPANYDLLARDEKERIGRKLRQRRSRDKKRKPSSKLAIAPLSAAITDMLSSSERHGMARRLEIWTRASSPPLAPQLRKPEKQHALMKATAAYAWYFNRHSKPPSRSALAKLLRCTEGQARRRLDVLKSLYGPGGPWAGA